MAIVGIGSNYSRAYEMYMAQKKETAPKAQPIETASEKAGDKKPVAEKAVSNYDSYLRKHYDCMSKGNVAISREYLKKSSGNSQEAKKLEDMVKKIPDLEKQGYEQLSAQNKAKGGTVTYYQQSWTINKDGSIQSTVYSVTETGMTNAERMKKTMDERLQRQKEKKEETEKAEMQKEKNILKHTKEYCQKKKVGI